MSGLRTIRSAHHDVERRPRRALAQSAEECASCSLPSRELVAQVPAPGGDHGKNKDPALAQQVLISVGLGAARRAATARQRHGRRSLVFGSLA